VFGRLAKVLRTKMSFDSKEEARRFFQRLTQLTKDWNRVTMDAAGFAELEQRVEGMIAEVADYA
jgi:V/A-type H+/Na+-transporting ATPase subunit A